jgi:protein-tyrosine phosphatase
VFNFRDLGGVAVDGGSVRPGRLLRSDALAGLTDDERATLQSLGIRTAIDLREPGERAHLPHGLDEITVHELPLIDGQLRSLTIDLVEFNEWMLEQRGAQLAEVVRRFSADDALPGVFFCSSGKDRTGMIAALILSALGAADEAVIADYALTETLLPEWYIPHAIQRALAGGLSEDDIESYVAEGLGSPASVMEGTLAALAKHGGAAAFLLAHGLTSAELESLRAALVAPV